MTGLLDDPKWPTDVTTNRRLTALEGPTGADHLVGAAPSPRQPLPRRAREAVVVLGPVARQAARVTLLAHVGVVVRVRAVHARPHARSLWEGGRPG